MADLATLDQSLLNFAQKESLEVLRQDSSYTFKQLAIECQTLYNNGGVTENGTNYSNKCCFWAIYHGLLHNQIYYVSGEKVSVFRLMKLADFVNRYELIDTDKLEHQLSIGKLMMYLPNVQLHFFIGRLVNGNWQTTPDPSVEFGKGTVIIRILNMGAHFEFITNPNTDFVRKPRTMNLMDASKNQTNIEYQIKQKNDDNLLAQQLAFEEIYTQSKIYSSIPHKSLYSWPINYFI